MIRCEVKGFTLCPPLKVITQRYTSAQHPCLCSSLLWFYDTHLAHSHCSHGAYVQQQWAKCA